MVWGLGLRPAMAMAFGDYTPLWLMAMADGSSFLFSL